MEKTRVLILPPRKGNMTIETYYEFGCDYCGCAIHPPAKSKYRAKETYREEGGIITSDGKTYCNIRCYKSRKAPNESS